MSDEDSSLEEKRVYADKDTTTEVYVAAGLGLARVSVSADLVGEFGLVYRGETLDVTVSNGRVAVATPQDVLVASTGDDELRFVETGFGPATAVGDHDGLVAAGGGRVGRFDGQRWRSLGQVDDVRAIDGDLVAAGSGVHRLDGTHFGLDDARDVAVETDVLAATADGLYRLGNGWMRELTGDVRTVAAGCRPRIDTPRAHAATTEALYERRDGTFVPVETSVSEPIADVGYGEATYAVTVDGTFLVDVGDGWRCRSLGLADVAALATR